MLFLINELGNEFLNCEIVDKLQNEKPQHSPQKAEWICAVVCQVWALAWARAWQEESVRTRRRSAASLAKIRRKTKTSVSWCCCWRRVRAGCVARQQAHGTIDWAPQAETSQFRAPVSRDRLGLLSYKIPPLFFSHLPKKVHFSFPRQMVCFFFFYVILVEELWNFGLKRNRREANVMYDLEFNAFLIIKSAPL